jgi:hypothetical protein
MVTIHNLQQHDNLEIYKKAFNIMDKYFPDEEEVDTNISAPTVDASGAFAVSLRIFQTSSQSYDTSSVPLGRQCSPRRIQLWSAVNDPSYV